MIFTVIIFFLLLLAIILKNQRELNVPIQQPPRKAAKAEVETLLPIPKHLKNILKPIGNKNNEHSVVGNIICTCDSSNFIIHYVGDASDYRKDRVIKVTEIDSKYYLIIHAKCLTCEKDHLIFDMHFHGWDGFVDSAEDEDQNLPRPQTVAFNCPKCDNNSHSLTIAIESQGMSDFISETEGDYPPEDWVEGFSWITIKTRCNNCDETNKHWISYETM
jgi:hypothetical protein